MNDGVLLLKEMMLDRPIDLSRISKGVQGAFIGLGKYKTVLSPKHDWSLSKVDDDRISTEEKLGPLTERILQVLRKHTTLYCPGYQCLETELRAEQLSLRMVEPPISHMVQDPAYTTYSSPGRDGWK